ncbi:hypothetical protein [Providencia sp. PROV258]|uniref:hypothetical protein n=1 Tax=Providencia sp. PROV258 TaxID=2949946 RepID=UPI002349F2F4|nr:hypothetical protein [Providencia sp. PROV258]
MNRLLFLFFLFSGQCLSEELTELPAGSSFIYPKQISTKWLYYTLSNCIGPSNPHANCRDNNDIVLDGEIEITIRLTQGTLNQAINNRINATNNSTTISRQGKFDWVGGGYGLRIEWTETVPGLICTPNDNASYQKCLSRYLGNTYTVKHNFMTSQSAAVWKHLSKYPLCNRGILFQNQLSTTGVSDIYSTDFESTCTKGGPNDITPPELEDSAVCSLNSQNLNLNYSSTNFNVTGLTQNVNLMISCTSGSAKNYKLKLTGSNVTNGRLNFGNGVSAQVSLNGTQVQANGMGIQLDNLTSKSIPVSATLMGSASSAGVSNATGVLILEAL